MSDFLIYSPTMNTLNAYASTLGNSFWNANTNSIIPAGPLPGGGSYFVNFATDAIPTGNTITDSHGNQVPEMRQLSGVWIRVRLNGENLFALGALPLPQAPIVVYPPTGTANTPLDYVQPPYGSIM